MTRTWMTVAFALVAIFGLACVSEDVGGGGGVAKGGSSGTGGTGGLGGWEVDEYLDEEDVCRATRPLEFYEYLGCPPTFEEAQDFDRGGLVTCIGTCGRWLSVQDISTPSMGCSYDPETGVLVGGVFGSDTADYCDRTSLKFVFGDGHHGCTFDAEEVDPECPFIDKET